MAIAKGFENENMVLHADGDSFFVACEVAMNPEYRGKAVIVGEDRGIAMAMSHEAKNMGITRGMPVFKIKRLFKNVIILPHHFDEYRKISKEVCEILESHLEHVERYSIDECFAVVKPSDIKFAGSVEKLVRDIKDEIEAKLGVTFSMGLARTKALAKTASKLDKPNGMVLLLNENDEREALRKTPIDDIWGIGRRTIPRLINMGMKTAYDFAHYPSAQIEKYFNEPLYLLQRETNGEPYHEVNFDSDPRDQKSIQSTATFKPSSSDPGIIYSEISENAEHACKEARALDLLTDSIAFFVKNTKFIYRFSDIIKLPFYTTDPSILLNAIRPKLPRLLAGGEKIRSTGVILYNLRRSEDVPRDLFGIQEKADEKNILEKVGDKIRDKYGRGALIRASSMKVKEKQRGNSFPK